MGSTIPGRVGFDHIKKQAKQAMEQVSKQLSSEVPVSAPA